MKAKTSLKELHRSANTYIDACRRFFSAIKRWETNGVYEEVEGIDWTALREFERKEILLSMSLVERAVEHLLIHSDEFEATLPDQWKAILPSSVRLGKLACENARALGWFEDMLGSFSGHQAAHQLRKSVMLLTFVADISTVESLQNSKREVLEVLLECGPTKGSTLARLTSNALEKTSSFRTMLSELVQDNLLIAGAGRYSSGYRLTDDGMRLAQLSRQLRHF